MSEEHANFSLSKSDLDDPTIGKVNKRHILCEFCKMILIPKGNAMKIAKSVSRQHLIAQIDMIKNSGREFDRYVVFWKLESMESFENVGIHSKEGDFKYLCCFNCESCIIGYTLTSVSLKYLMSKGPIFDIGLS